MASLLWKEWHEQRWKLGFGCLILGAFALIGLQTRVVADVTVATWACFLGILLLPVLATMGLVPAERQEGTFEALLALPVPAWRIFLAKTILGILLCAGPLIVAAGVTIVMAGGREMLGGEIVWLYARSIAATLALFVWMFALTVRLPTEARAGLLSLGVLIIWLLASAGMLAYTPDISFINNRHAHAPWIWVINPFVFTLGFESLAIATVPILLALLVQLIIATALWLWARSRMAAEGAA